jgi:hypothetical protein
MYSCVAVKLNPFKSVNSGSADVTDVGIQNLVFPPAIQKAGRVNLVNTRYVQRKSMGMGNADDISCGLLYFFHYLIGQKLFVKDLEVNCEIQ